jgi:dTDP-4-dehydrorhamnose 3,5-epimerase
MIKVDTPIKDLFIIKPDIFNDDRGFFFESFSEKKYNELGIKYKFVQDNISYSSYGTIRGLHYQIGEFAQGKLCQVLMGKVVDVALDIRFNSPTFGKSFCVELSSENKEQFWIPPGFAHGFAVISESALFSYKCTNYYSKNDERCIIYNDQDLKINWGIENSIISNKDLKGIKFKNIAKDFIYENNME